MRSLGPGRLAVAVFIVASAVAGSLPVAGAAAADRQPPVDGPAQLEATIDVNIVFYGIEPLAAGEIDTTKIDTAAMSSYFGEVSRVDPFVDNPGFPSVPYGLNVRHNLVFAPPSAERRVFNRMAAMGRPTQRSVAQNLYNAQINNEVDVPDTVLMLDAPATEKMLIEESRRLPGIRQGYTVVLMDWSKDPTFKFHSYDHQFSDVETGNNPTTTGYPTIAWGGTHGKLWFYDWSAGPEYTSAHWLVDDNPDDLLLPRIPPIWEIDDTPPPTAMAQYPLWTWAYVIAIYLAQDAFFAPPRYAYDPADKTPLGSGDKTVPFSVFEGDPTYRVSRHIDARGVVRDAEKLQPYEEWRYSVRQFPFTADVDRMLLTSLNGPFGNPVPPGSCVERNGWPSYFSEPFCFVEDNAALYAPRRNANDAVIPVLAIAVPTDPVVPRPYLALDSAGPSGEAGVVMAYTSPEMRQSVYDEVPLGWGIRNNEVHELGHFAGLAHPFNACHPQLLFCGGNFGYWRIANSVHSPMNYFYPGLDFGQFDRDQVDRGTAAVYYTRSQAVLAEVTTIRPSLAREVRSRLSLAASAFAANDWTKAVRYAKQAYVSATTVVRHDRDWYRAARPTGTARRSAPIGPGIEEQIGFETIETDLSPEPMTSPVVGVAKRR